MESTNDVTQERRLFERFSARFPAKFQHEVGDYGNSVFMRDASAGGLKVTARQKLFLHDAVSLEIKLPDLARPFRLNGRVVWTQDAGPDLWNVGVEFHKIDLMRLHRIYKFISPD